jgi:hypothetical protein
VGQKAAIAAEWSEQIELSADPEKNKGRGRPKGTVGHGALSPQPQFATE